MTERTRRTKDEWLALFKRQEESQMSNSEFCRQENLNDKYYGKRKKEMLDPASSDELGFIKLSKKHRRQMSNGGVIALQHNHTSLHIPLHTDPHWVASLVKALS